jgi:hypothetical protein
MIAEKFYIEKFLSRVEADRLLEFSLGLPPTRRVIMPWGVLSRFVSLQSYSEFPSPHHVKNYGDGVRLSTAPEEVKQLSATLSEFAGKPVNYLSFNAYLNEHDGMAFHQHAEDRDHPDQSVWVVSLGAARAVTLRPLGCTDKRKYETLYPAHGSLYILPSMYNTTHEHEVPSSKTPCGVRVGINCKSIPAPQEAAFTLSADDGPKIYDCHAGKKYPADAVYVGREVRDRQTGKVSWSATPFGNHNRRKTDTPEGKAAWLADVAEKMKDAGFRRQVESLRGKDLLCWCKVGEPNCHARIWLELANAPK